MKDLGSGWRRKSGECVGSVWVVREERRGEERRGVKIPRINTRTLAVHASFPLVLLHLCAPQ